MRQRLNSNSRWHYYANAHQAATGEIFSLRKWIGAVLLVVWIFNGAAHAGERRFVNVYEATTQKKGAVEYEQWITWKADKANDSSFNRFDFRHELEFGVTDRFQVGLYFSDWRYERSKSGNSTEWRDVAVELIYNLTDPNQDALGSALYGEIKLGDELFELEGKVILQKNFGKWALAWNGTIEAEWEGESYSDNKGVFEQTFGASYQLSPHFLVGMEFLHEIEFDDWSDVGDDVVYIGPNFSHRTSKWWITIAPLFQVTSIDDEPDFQTRILIGFDF